MSALFHLYFCGRIGAEWLIDMSISKYEAASLYDYTISHMDAHYLVLDFDDCSYGYCRCNNQGTTELLHSWTSISSDLWKMCVEALKKIVGNDYPFDVDQEFLNQITSRNDLLVLHNYFNSDRQYDEELYHFSGKAISCQEFESLLSGVKAKLDDLFSHIRKQLDSNMLIDSKIIILGRAQRIAMLTFYVKEKFSGDPLLPDDRFRNAEFKDSVDSIIELGMRLYEAKSTIQKTYSLMIYDRESDALEELLSLKKGQSGDSLQKINYVGPVLLTEHDSLTMRIDGRKVDINIPYSFNPLESDLIDLGIGMQVDQVILSIRRCRFPTRIYSVALG